MASKQFVFKMDLPDALEFAAFLEAMAPQAEATMDEDISRSNLILRANSDWRKALVDQFTDDELKAGIEQAEEDYG